MLVYRSALHSHPLSAVQDADTPPPNQPHWAFTP